MTTSEFDKVMNAIQLLKSKSTNESRFTVKELQEHVLKVLEDKPAKIQSSKLNVTL